MNVLKTYYYTLFHSEIITGSSFLIDCGMVWQRSYHSTYNGPYHVHHYPVRGIQFPDSTFCGQKQYVYSIQHVY